jgi:cytochrome b6-f complex iron-sulfur subunit
MPLIDDLSAVRSQEEVNRRKFLGLAGSGALAAALGGTAVTAVQYISPNVLYEAETRVKIAGPESIAPGTVLALAAQKVYVVRTAKGFFALSAVCTHLGCMTRFESPLPPEGGEKSFFCPCHGSRFSLEGAVVGGPAPRALPRLKVTLEGGALVVDLKRPAGPQEVLEV